MESSTLSQLKPVVVRVKRRLSQAPLDAFCLSQRLYSFILFLFYNLIEWSCLCRSDFVGLEVNEKPSKRACLDFAKLTVSEPVQSGKFFILFTVWNLTLLFAFDNIGMKTFACSCRMSYIFLSLKTCIEIAFSFVLSTLSVLCLLLNKITSIFLAIDVSDKIPTKIFVQHIDTVSNAEVTKEAVESFIVSRTPLSVC